MTTINFYRIHGHFEEAMILACQLVEKAQRSGMTTLLATPDEATSTTLDELMWSFRNDAFVPHAIEDTPSSPVVISHHNQPGGHHGLLINLGRKPPSWFPRFEKMVEIVYDEQQVMEDKREQFKYYKDRGYPINYFDLTKS